MQLQPTPPKDMIKDGQSALKTLRDLVTNRPDKEKLVINGKQYLYFHDWQTLGVFFGITAKVTETIELTRERPNSDGTLTFLEPIGFLAKAVAVCNDVVISAADAECLFEEKNWREKPRFQVRSMAQTRACAKALRNCLSWIVKLPNSAFTDEIAEESQNYKL